MNIIQFVYIVILWGLPILFAARSFRKMEEENRQVIMKEMKTPLFIIGIAPLTIGLLLFFTGSVSVTGIKFLRYLGIGLAFFGWCVVWVAELININNSAVKSILMILIGIFVMGAYFYLL